MQAQVSTACNTTLELSDERDQWLRRVHGAYREGWDACLVALADAIGGRITPPRPTALEILRWGPAGREHFGDARPGDFLGGALPR